MAGCRQGAVSGVLQEGNEVKAAFRLVWSVLVPAAGWLLLVWCVVNHIVKKMGGW